MDFGFMNVVLLHNNDRNISATCAAIFSWGEQEFKYSYNVPKSLDSEKIIYFFFKTFGLNSFKF
jgi:hypothetical protein